MQISRILISGFRNFPTFEMNPKPGFNIITGPNGAGKTSILEAIHFLSTARSHRTSQMGRIISHDAEQFTIFVSAEAEDGEHQIGVSRTRTGESKAKLDGKNQTSHVDIAYLMPVLMFNPESFSLLTDGSKGRRQMLDWGVFHAQSDFYLQWQIAKKALAQRNAALKTGLSDAVLNTFDNQLVAASVKLDQYRTEYVEALKPIVDKLIGDFLERHDVKLQYHRGWAAGEDLSEILSTHRLQDRQKGFTHHGAHRADLRPRVGRMPAQDILSRGQQKLLICALKIAQGILFAEQTGKKPVYLLDDIASELDEMHRGVLINHLEDLDAQVFITTISQNLLTLKESEEFMLDDVSV